MRRSTNVVLFFCVSLLAAAAASAAHAQTRRDLIPVGFEFCMRASQDLRDADAFAVAHGIQPLQRTEMATDYVLPGEDMPPFLRTTKHWRGGDGGFSVECGFDAFDVDSVSGQDIAGWAARFGLEPFGGQPDVWRYESDEVGVMVSPITRVPCPTVGDADRSVAEMYPEIHEHRRQVCGRSGLRFTFQSGRLQMP